MPRRVRKFILWAVMVLVGVPLVVIGVLLAWMRTKDATNGTIVSVGEVRRYLLHVPKNYDRTRPTPLIISLHPAALWPAFQMQVSKWNDLAEQHGFIVVYPAGTGFPHIWHTKPNFLDSDVRFISDLLDKLQAQYNIDPDRIYVNGYSQGAGMAFILSCRMSNRIAAVATVAAAQERPFSWCQDATPMPLIDFHGTADFVPYKGGKSPDPFNPVIFPDVRQWASDWAHRNQCSSQTTEEAVAPHTHRLSFSNCSNTSSVVLYTLDGAGHTWPGSDGIPTWLVGPTSHEIDATQLIWEFYQQHPRITH